MRVASIYLPNGNPIGTDKFAYKLAWMERLSAHARGAARPEEPWCWPATTTSSRAERMSTIPKAWASDALFQPRSRAALPRV